MSKLTFKKPTPETMDSIWELMQLEPGRTCDFSYGGFRMWIDIFDYKYCIYNDTLFIQSCIEGKQSGIAYSLPIGKLNLKNAISILREHCRLNNTPLTLSAVPEYALEDLKKLGTKSVQILDGWGDYLYDARMLAELHGKKMSKKRNHVHQFTNQYGSDNFEPLSAHNIEAAHSFLTRLDDEQVANTSAAMERSLTKELLNVFENYNTPLLGGVLKINGEVEALTIGDIKNDTLFIHVEKANRNFIGSYEMINKAFAEHIIETYPDVLYINREDDSGDPGLRQAKESYHPLEILNKYNVELMV